VKGTGKVQILTFAQRAGKCNWSLKHIQHVLIYDMSVEHNLNGHFALMKQVGMCHF